MPNPNPQQEALALADLLEEQLGDSYHSDTVMRTTATVRRQCDRINELENIIGSFIDEIREVE